MGVKSSKVYLRLPILTVTNQIGNTGSGGGLLVLNRTRTGSSNPNWRQQVKNNVSATTVFSGTAEYFSYKTGTSVATRPKGYVVPYPPFLLTLFETADGCYPAQLLFGVMPAANAGLDITIARNQALTRLYQAIRAQTNHFQGGTFLGEFKESLETIRNVTKKIAKLIPHHLASQQKLTKKYVGSYVIGPNGSAVRVKDFNPRKGKMLPLPVWAQFRKDLADNWLEFAFGIRPLVKDVKDGAEALARFQYDNIHEHVRGFGTSSTVYLDTATQFVVGGAALTRGIVFEKRRYEAKVTLRAGLQFSIDSPAFGSAGRLQSLLGFRLQDFVPTMWNLLPYSFLVDYFVNVGDILSALTTDTSAVRWVAESDVRSHFREFSTRCSPYPGAGDPTDSVDGSLGSCLAETRVVNRYPAVLDIPKPVVTIPGITNDRGEFNQQMLNMAALLVGGKGARRGF